MTSLWSDIKYTWRSLRRAPMFAIVAVLSLALGIGANTAIFSLLDQVLLRLLPVKDPKELVLFIMRGQHYGGNWGLSHVPGFPGAQPSVFGNVRALCVYLESDCGRYYGPGSS